MCRGALELAVLPAWRLPAPARSIGYAIGVILVASSPIAATFRGDPPRRGADIGSGLFVVIFRRQITGGLLT